MPIAIHIDHQRQLTTFTATGEVTLEEQLGALRTFYDDAPTAHAVWDMRALQGRRLDPMELRQIIDFVKAHGHQRPAGKTALITASDLDYGLSRVSDALADTRDLHWTIRPFRDPEEAMAWIASEDP